MDKRMGFLLTYVFFALMGILLVHDLLASSGAAERIPYSKFQALLREDKVGEVVISDNAIEGVLKAPDEGKRFVTTRVPPEVAGELDRHGIRYSGKVRDPFVTTLLAWIVPALLFFGGWLLISRRRSAGGAGPSASLMTIGKSKAKIYVEHDTKVSFKDVAGVDEAKAELQEVVAFLKDPAAYGRLGARMPRGILLVGPPGTGKTLLARAVAGEAAVPFFSISGSAFVEMFVGVGAARVRDLFEQAREKAPCIIFIDELDALGRARGAYPGLGGHDEKEQTLNQLLVELDGFDPAGGIVLLAATNRPEILDAALLRAGRFDRHVLVDRPDRIGRTAILLVHLKKLRLAPDVAAEQVAALTPGFTGADLANLANEAALVATRSGAAQITMADFTSAIERVVAGLEKKNRLLNPRERKVVAVHEMGHALVAAALPDTDPVHKVSILPRGVGALGYTIQRPTEDRYLMSRSELENKMAVLLGGRAAEHVVFDQLSTGAADDLAKATEIAMTMVTRYAMVPELGNMTYDVEQGGPGGARRPHSEQTAREIDCAARAIAERAFKHARRVIERNREVLQQGAAALYDRETMGEGELAAAFARLEKEPPFVSAA